MANLLDFRRHPLRYTLVVGAFPALVVAHALGASVPLAIGIAVAWAGSTYLLVARILPALERRKSSPDAN